MPTFPDVVRLVLHLFFDRLFWYSLQDSLLQLFFDFSTSGHRHVAARSAACRFVCVASPHSLNSIFRRPAIALTL